MTEINIECPHCHITLGTTDTLLGSEVLCPSCGKKFIVKNDPDSQEQTAVNSPQSDSENQSCISNLKESAIVTDEKSSADSHTSKRWIVGVLILIAVICICVLLSMTTLVPYWKNRNVQQFKDHFAEQYRDTLRDPNSLMIDWKIACISDDKTKFWSIACIRAKNAMGGYADPIFMKIYGLKNAKDNSKYTFYRLQIDNHPLLYNQVNFNSFQAFESKQLQQLLREMDQKIQKAVQLAKKDLARIVMPKKNKDQVLNFSLDRIYLGEHVESIYTSHINLLKEYGANKDLFFYRDVMPGQVPNLQKQLAELDNLGKEAKKRYDSILSLMQKLELKEKERRAEELRQQELKRKEELRQQELKRKEDLRKYNLWRKKSEFDNLKSRMVRSAVSLYERNHNWKQPNAELILKYRNLVNTLFPQLRAHYKKIQYWQQKINSMPASSLSEEEKIRLNALNQLLREENTKFNFGVSQLLAGIHCQNPKCQCQSKKLSSSSLSIDFTSDSYDEVINTKAKIEPPPSNIPRRRRRSYR